MSSPDNIDRCSDSNDQHHCDKVVVGVDWRRGWRSGTACAAGTADGNGVITCSCVPRHGDGVCRINRKVHRHVHSTHPRLRLHCSYIIEAEHDSSIVDKGRHIG